IVRAMPRLSFLMADMILEQLSDALVGIGIYLHGVSLSEQRHVRRIPLKPVPLTEEEASHLAQSFDGLSVFEPVDIYNVNIQVYSGLMRSLRQGHKYPDERNFERNCQANEP